MIELSIIKLFLSSRDIYNKYYNYININYIKNNIKDLYKVFIVIYNYYNNYNTKENIALTELEAYYISMYPVLKEADRRLLSSLLKQIEESSVSEGIIAYLEQHRIRGVAGELALVAFDVAEGKKKIEELEAVYGKLDLFGVKEEHDYVTDDLEELYENQTKEKGLRWRLRFLNQSLGSLRRGDFGFLFARPETGKTTFLASEATNFASQSESSILWCNNEEGGKKVQIRVHQATLNLTYHELMSDRERNKQRYKELTQNKIKIFDEKSMSTHDIEARCKELNPSLIIIDQLDKLSGYKEDRYDLQMKQLYIWARKMAQDYGPVIAVCQAGGTAEGKRWLNMNDVDSSHTAKQGEADWMLGIGKSNDEGMSNIRFFNISKNKLIGDEDTLSELRHGKAEIVIDAERARYRDL